MEVNKETDNVQQAESLAGQVSSQAVAVQDIVGEAVNEPSKEEVKVAERRKALSETLITLDTVVEPLRYSLSVDGVGVFSLLDIHGVKAKQKAGKTTMLKVCAAAWLRGEQFRVKSELEAPRVLWLDTEQNRPDVKQILTDIVEMTDVDADYITSHLHVHALRCCSYEGLYDLMVQAVTDFKPQVVIVDGIVEFVASFNDEAIAKKLMHDLQVMSQEHECAVVCVLHTNKADEDHNMRGHLGTMLAQKAGTVVECRKQGGIISVTCSESRHQEMPEWSITFDGEGHIVDADEQRQQFIEKRKADQQQKRRESAEAEKKERLETCIRVINDKGGQISRKQLTEILTNMLKRKRPTVSAYITEWINDKHVFEADGIITLSAENIIPF